jgi:hypothetical protein
MVSAISISLEVSVTQQQDGMTYLDILIPLPVFKLVVSYEPR